MQLIQFDSIYSALQDASTIEEIKNGHDALETLKVIVREQRLGFEIGHKIDVATLECEVKGGELLDEEFPHRGLTKMELTHGKLHLKDIGLTFRQSANWRTISIIPSEVRQDYYGEMFAKKKKATRNGLLKIAKDLERELARNNAAEIIQGNDDPSIILKFGPFIEAMKSLENESVSLIFTDPPYDAESIPLYGLLAQEAARVLKPGGGLIAYAGHYALPQILTDMSEYLRYWWMISLKHSGNSARLPGKWVMVGWKPLVWFVKGGRFNNEYIADFFETSKQPDKILHDWQQDVSEAAYYVEYLTEPGELVCDPFLGSGTTLLAAKKLGRRVWGCDIDEEKVNIARGRLHDNS